MADLPKRELGRTGLQVTMLGYGAMELRGAPRARDTTEAQAETILNAVLDSGINYIDTSIDYGVSEERIGRYISHRRSEYYLASKCGCLVGAPAVRGQVSPHVFTRDNILVPRVIHIVGYNLFSLTRASAVVNCQSAVVWCLLRLASHSWTSSIKVCLSGMRRSRH